ncbi:aminotransferase class V-fold PLP-dependent enzyme [Halocella sp. SP3-1]|uniref:aminotransferase class V-fold PLP-dependent enzyme n=1 Tax=Halocella sp. SP3-1 TaxID=2382161 RepID=UPI000F75622A|nr:aminotransferase class V-fold PLP-dependent enzyme [Halocella sp. SP3-1]AZO94717.1 aminotransferase class V-fold PLP-dependent enzyme [Halocella sp. SP3-1]
MIYVNNAATTWPKPERVYHQMDDFSRKSGLNPGRAGSLGVSAVERKIFEVRKKVGDLINTSDYSRVIFTSGSTESLNMGIKGLLERGDHVITTALEHNSVLRPLKKLERDEGIELSLLKINKEGKIDINELESRIKDNTRLIVTTHASNVIGTVLDIKEIGQLAKKRGITYLVDAAQTAGLFELDIKEMGIDLLALAGHKSLYGPAGIGVLYIGEGVELNTIKEGGTGTNSLATYQPDVLPDKYEAGTPNIAGIVGLGAGVDYIADTGCERIKEDELKLTERLLDGLKALDRIIIYGKLDIESRAPVVGFNIQGMASAELAYILENRFNILVRAGLHCAPLLHQALGTDKQGMVRVSFSCFNTMEEVDIILNSLKEIIEEV